MKKIILFIILLTTFVFTLQAESYDINAVYNVTLTTAYSLSDTGFNNFAANLADTHIVSIGYFNTEVGYKDFTNQSVNKESLDSVKNAKLIAQKLSMGITDMITAIPEGFIYPRVVQQTISKNNILFKLVKDFTYIIENHNTKTTVQTSIQESE